MPARAYRIHLVRREPLLGSESLDRFQAVLRRLHPKWCGRLIHARAPEGAELEAKNMVLTGGVHAIGVELTDHLPGYWLNYFGAPFVELIGASRLATAPVSRKARIGPGFVLELYGASSAWDTPAGREEALRAFATSGATTSSFATSRGGPTSLPLGNA